MKKFWVVLSLSLSACGLLSDNVKVVADSARAEFYDRGDLKDSMTYHKKVSLEIDTSNRCILVESVAYPDVVYCMSDLQYDADMSDYWRKNTRLKEIDGCLFYVFKAKFEDSPSADATIVFFVHRRPSNKQLLSVEITRWLEYDSISDCVRYSIKNKRSLKRLDGDFFEELERQCQIPKQEERILPKKAGNLENTTKKAAKSKSDDVYEYTGESFSIVDEDGFPMNYGSDYSVWMKLHARGYCSFDMKVDFEEDYAIALHFDGSAYPEKGAGWFKGSLDIHEGKNRKSVDVYFYWNKDIDDWTIYDSRNDRPVVVFSRYGEYD